ncbi:MAG: MFS transporter [Odoribacter sp.]
MTSEPIKDGLPLPGRNWAMGVVALGMAVAVLDGAIANVALPTIARDLRVSPATSIWVVNAFQLAMTISLLVFSSLGDLWGYKRVFVLGLLMFSITSLICALSDSFVTLVIARGLQGFSAAAIISVNTALLRIIFPLHLLPRGMGINALIIAVAAAAGPTVAAGILAIANWPWLFAINVPIGLLALGLSIKFLPKNPVKVTGQRFDVTGAILNALTFGLLICVIDGFAHHLRGYILYPGIVAMLLIGWFFIRRQLHHPYPLLPVDLLHNRIFTLSLLTSVFSFIAQMLALVSIPFFFQRVLHFNEVLTGLLLTPWPLATMVAAPLAGRLIGRVNAGILSSVGLLIFGISLFLLATMPADPTHIDIIWRMVLSGIGFGTFLTPNNNTIITSAPEDRSGGASGMLGMARILGQTIGAALAAVMFASFPAHSMHYSLFLGTVIIAIAIIISMTRIKGIPRNQ